MNVVISVSNLLYYTVLYASCCSDIPPDIDDVVISVNNKEKMSKDKEVCE